METVRIQPLTKAAFAPFGDIIEIDGPPSFQINRGMCDRYHDLAALDFIGEGARANVSMARAKPYELPLTLDMVERHPFGSQAFVPLSPNPFLVIVAPDDNGVPQRPLAFEAKAGQGVNYHCNIWHGVLTPIGHQADFIIVDREGEGDNLEEYFFETPFQIVRT